MTIPYSVEEEENRLMSRINSAGLINLTLKNLWDDYYKHFRQAMYFKANADLDCLWVEFGGDVDDDSQNGKKTIEEFEKIEGEIAKAFAVQTNPNGFMKQSKEQTLAVIKQCAVLKKKALFLKRLMNSQGKGTAYEESIDDYLD
jgi:hypothetical protein